VKLLGVQKPHNDVRASVWSSVQIKRMVLGARSAESKLQELDQILIGGKSTAPRYPNVRHTGHQMVCSSFVDRAEIIRLTTTFHRSHSRAILPRLALAESEGRVRIFDWSSDEVYTSQLSVIFECSESPANAQIRANNRMCPSGRPMSLIRLVEPPSSALVRLLLARLNSHSLPRTRIGTTTRSWSPSRMVRLSSSILEKQATYWPLGGTRTNTNLGSPHGSIGTEIPCTLVCPILSYPHPLPFL